MRRHPPELRSSPRKRGPRDTERGHWIPACAGMNGMERRAFIAALAASATAWPHAARAQQRMRRIGVLMNRVADDPQSRLHVAAFQQRLQELGWTNDANVRIEYRWG